MTILDLKLRDIDYYLKEEDEKLSPFATKNKGEAIGRINPDEPGLEGELAGEYLL